MGKRGLCLAGASAVLFVSAGISMAGAGDTANRFAGSCSVKGDVTFNPPVTYTEQALAVTYNAAGTCSGNLNGQSISNMPVKLEHSGHSQGSCLGAQTTGPGHGSIIFANGTVIPYEFTFKATGTEVDFAFTGQKSGTANGHGSFLTNRTPPDAAINCAGKGDAKLPMDMSLKTESTLVSKRARGKSRLRLRGHPRRITAGRRADFTFHVAGPDGQAAPKAVVLFAGHRAKVGSDGRAKIAATVRRGRHRARASAPDFRSDTLVIRATR